MKNNNPFIKIIILNYNGREDTIECINSLLKIDYKNYKILLVDNNSSDGSLEDFKKKYAKNKKIKIIRNKRNYGFAGGNNRAIKQNFNSNYFLLLNNDTIVKEDFLNILVDFAKKNKNVGVVAPAIYKYSNKKQLNKINSPANFNFKNGGGQAISHDKNIISPFEVDYASGCCWLIKKEIIKKTEWFKEKYFAYNEELEWAYRIKKIGYKFFIIPLSKIYHKGERTTSKISGFRLYYGTRNMIWFEREYASSMDLTIFYFYLFIYKIPKMLIKIVKGKERKICFQQYFKGIKEGLFSDYI